MPLMQIQAWDPDGRSTEVSNPEEASVKGTLVPVNPLPKGSNNNRTHLRRKNRNTRQEEDHEHQTDTGQPDTDEARQLDLSTHTLPKRGDHRNHDEERDEERRRTRGITSRKGHCDEHEDSRRGEKTNTRIHDTTCTPQRAAPRVYAHYHTWHASLLAVTPMADCGKWHVACSTEAGQHA